MCFGNITLFSSYTFSLAIYSINIHGNSKIHNPQKYLKDYCTITHQAIRLQLIHSLYDMN